jgi:hypothetical protein
MKTAVALASLLLATAAHAQPVPSGDLDDPPGRGRGAPGPEVVHVDQLVVVTPNPPVVVNQNGVAPAKAGTDAADLADPAPHNEEWSNVSHINGRPVPVGERSHYLYKYKRVNIAIDPISPFFSLIDGSIAYGVTQNIAISGSLLAYTKDNSWSQVGVTAPIYFRRTFSGPFIEPGLVYYSNNGDSYAGPTMMVGWHWSFDSGLNLAFALGVSKRLDAPTYGSSDPQFNGYFRVGYAFGDAK